MSDTARRVFVWLVAGIFLVILADYLPKVTVWLVALIMVSVLLLNYEEFNKLFSAMR